MREAVRVAWVKCEDVLRSLSIPMPFTLEKFAESLSSSRGKRVVLMPTELAPGAPCGTLITTDSAEYVYYAANTTRVHAVHIALHEIGHLLLGHVGTSVVDTAIARAMFPDLSPALIRRMLARTVYSDNNELEAELFASIIAQRTDAAERPAGRSDAVDDEGQGQVDRLRDTFQF